MSLPNSIQPNLPRFSPGSVPASQNYVDDAINDLRYQISQIPAGGGGGSQTPWTSNINAAGHNLSNLGLVNGYSSTPNMFSLRSTVVIAGPVENGNWVTIIDVTGQDIVAGFLRVRGTSGDGDSCDVIVHVDATPMGTPEISICQFQGATTTVTAPKLQGQSASGDNRFVLSIIPTDANGWSFTIDGFGDSLPILSEALSGGTGIGYRDPISGQTSSAMFQLVNGQIAANSLQAKTFTIVDSMGGMESFASSLDNVTGGYTFGTSKANIVCNTIQFGAGNPPTFPEDTGLVPGTIAWDANYIYIAIDASNWKRTPLSTW